MNADDETWLNFIFISFINDYFFAYFDAYQKMTKVWTEFCAYV